VSSGARRIEYGAAPEVGAPSAWAVSGMWFAASLMTLIGTFQVLAGLAAIVNKDFFIVTPHYTYDLNVTAWGWITLIIGVILACAGAALFSGKPWAAIFTLLIAGLSAVNNFLFIPYYPWWSLLVIALDAWVIWSITRPGAVST
jgi:hypothetical protein